MKTMIFHIYLSHTKVAIPKQMCTKLYLLFLQSWDQTKGYQLFFAIPLQDHHNAAVEVIMIKTSHTNILMQIIVYDQDRSLGNAIQLRHA